MLHILFGPILRRVRRYENAATGAVRSPEANDVVRQPTIPWDATVAGEAAFCLLVSFRRDGTPVPTPMWAGCDGTRVVVRSGRSDAKVGRVRLEPRVLLAACDARGRPRSAPMEGRARILESRSEVRRAEAVLRQAYGAERRLYGLVRAPFLRMTYIEIGDVEEESA